MLDLSDLNPAQREAVLTTEGPLLVLAGAGSGKTRVLTYRIAHLVKDLNIAPWNILAVTFTNKAANEMRERLGRLVPNGLQGMWICTFHSMCVRILRANAGLLGYTEDFTIYDADDSKRLIKAIMADYDYTGRQYSENAIRGRISAAKNDLVAADSYKPRSGDPFDKVFAQVFKVYQQRLKRANAMDFDDLLFNAYMLFKDNEDILDAYGRRFRYILVDEYQDTNAAQYEITKMLARGYGNLMVVGDDDQSIYSWRGADVRNILDFERDWPGTKTVKLEENYRSTETILECANAVISHNQARKDKKLIATGQKGEKAALYLAADERDEGVWIAARCEQLHAHGSPYNETAVFYRTNAQSRILEDMFLRAGVPYRIVGGTRFFDRAEIRDVAAYLKVIVNPADDVSCVRIINTPRRGIGKTTIERISMTAMQRGIPFLQAAREEALDPACRAAAKRALVGFIALIDELSAYSGDLCSVVDMIIEKTQIVSVLESQNNDDARGRIENIHEFMNVVREYAEEHELVPDHADRIASVGTGDEEHGFHEPLLSNFMEWLSLRTDLDSLGTDERDCVTFMTVHSAKGLEFDNVFVAGMEESIFPHTASMMENGIEEERRLAYVAITRARKRLFLTYAARRRIYNDLQANACSRFINEIPQDLLLHEGVGSMGLEGSGWEKRGDRRGIAGSGQGEDMYGGHVYGSGGYSAASSNRSSASAVNQTPAGDFAEGDTVDHKTFGQGSVVKVEGDKISIYFKKSGKVKTLLKGYAPLVKIG